MTGNCGLAWFRGLAQTAGPLWSSLRMLQLGWIVLRLEAYRPLEWEWSESFWARLVQIPRLRCVHLQFWLLPEPPTNALTTEGEWSMYTLTVLPLQRPGSTWTNTILERLILDVQIDPCARGSAAALLHAIRTQFAALPTNVSNVVLTVHSHSIRHHPVVLAVTETISTEYGAVDVTCVHNRACDTQQHDQALRNVAELLARLAACSGCKRLCVYDPDETITTDVVREQHGVNIPPSFALLHETYPEKRWYEEV